MDSEKIIEIDNLNKSFKEVHAVNDLSFSVRKGELFAFLGVNGAGKSTTISIMCGKIPKDSGTVLINGADADDATAQTKSCLGVVFQNSVLDKHLTVYDNLQSRAALYGITGENFRARYNELAALLHFADLSKRTLGKLSGGQRRRIDIARALLHKPEILVLDEPTTGLDPQTRKLLWQVVTDLREREGLTVFLTTHYMEEAADADYVVIIDGGKKAAEGTPLDLKNKYTNDYINVYGRDISELNALGYPCKEVGGAVRISVPDTAHAAKLIAEHGELFTDFEIFKGNMDDVFLAVTGKELAGGEFL
ncbi:MAG: ABC transporter ATP-binding protein [Clostridia bacterium]|nr:ABC transporter ATP-binding protein [Clostridia bacterium]